MDMAVELNKAIAPQWLRLAFHDAGTFNVQVPEGGANGCLLTDDVMRSQPENHSLDLAIDTLRFIEGRMINATVDSIRLSSADLIQFAGFFVAVRQRGTPGLDFRKRRELRTNFQWGRLDETNCQARWTENLPGFELNAEATNIPQRCRFAGREIRVKMMDRNGFTAREATALIGAHTIGLTRNVFGPDLAGPWVETGADDATPQGPVFDNGYHKFLIDSIPASTVGEFAATQFPFDQTFPTWFRANVTDLNYLDTDIVLGFPSQNTLVHPHYDTFSREFAGSNTEFIDSFMAALDKMSKLGVDLPLLPASNASSSCGSPLPKANAPLPKANAPSMSPVSAPIMLIPSTFAPTTKPETFTSGLLASIVDAGVALLNETLVERKDEIAILTTPVVLNSTGADMNTTVP
jgi:catalase (peroxidase I)